MTYRQLTIKLSCPQCEFNKKIFIFADEDDVFSIPDKFCPKCLHALSREMLEANKIKEVVNVVIKSEDESTEEDIETGTADTLPDTDGDLDRSQDGADSPEDTEGESEVENGDPKES